MQVKVHLSFPSKFAGPLIGKQASNLAHIKKFSGASKIHVFPKDREAPERYIEIIGTPLQQYFVSIINFVALAPFSMYLELHKNYPKIMKTKEMNHQGLNALIFEQILPTNTIGNVWSTVRRIYILIIVLRGIHHYS